MMMDMHHSSLQVIDLNLLVSFLKYLAEKPYLVFSWRNDTVLMQLERIKAL